MNGQVSMFDGNHKLTIDKPIRLIELFAGYGSQALALKYLGVSFEHWRICEWAVKSIQAYKDAHCKDDSTDYSKDHSDKFILDILTKWGISANYNEPMSKDQIKRLGVQKQRQIYNNIMATHNLVNIQQVHGEDLEIKDTDKYTYIMTYSFPCQDLSLAGKQAGMEKGSGTRSGMLWEVERILTECYELDTMPQILLMENVPQVHSTKNIEDFNKWIHSLESMGYKNYWEDMIATDYEIPQTRKRTFMVSILGNYTYEFPKPIPLTLKLKDMLEDDVDEKYYLSDKMKTYIFSENEKYTGNNKKSIINRDVAVTITTRIGNTRADASDYVCNGLPINYNIKSSNETLKQKMCNNLIVSGKVKEYDVIRHSYSTSRMNGEMKDIQQNNISPTLDTRCDCLGVVVKSNNKRLKSLAEKMDLSKDNLFLDIYNQSTSENAGTITTRVDASNSTAVYTGYRIRKLTPKECFRLMGVKDQDFENIARNQSNASLYHLAGDSIITNVLMAIFRSMI